MPHPVPEDLAPVIIRAIHTSADFEYADSLCFSEGVMDIARKALKNGATIVTDTNMALAGINRGALEKLGCRKICFMADPEVAAAAKENGFTRAAASVDKAASINGPLIYAVGKSAAVR